MDGRHILRASPESTVLCMLSLRALRRTYPDYVASPSRSQTPVIDQSYEGLSEKERASKAESNRQKEREADPHYVTWESDDDPDSPHNWSVLKKWSILVGVSIITIIVSFSSAVFSADAKIVSTLYGISIETAQLGTSLYLLGFSLGPLFFGPLSEAFGRSPVYIGTFLAFLLCQLGPAVGQNPQAIFISRFFAGFFGASPLSNSGGSIDDIFDPLERSLAFPMFALMQFLGPTTAPLVSGACSLAGTRMLSSIVDWRWIYWLTMIWGGAILLVMVAFLPETQSSTILYHKAIAIRRQTGDDRYYSDVDKREESALRLFINAFPKPVIMLVTEPIIMALSFYLLVIYSILYMDIEGYSLLFANDYYKFNLVQVGLAFMPIILGVVVSGATGPLQYWDYKQLYSQALKDGKPMASPEVRLRPLLFGGFFVPIGIFWLGWTARPGVYWAAPVLAGVPFGIGLLSVFLSSYQYLIDCYGSLSATALAAATLARYAGAGGLAMVVHPLYMNLAYSNASGQQIYAWPLSLLGFISILCLPIPFILYFGAGKWLRQKSPHCVKF